MTVLTKPEILVIGGGILLAFVLISVLMLLLRESRFRRYDTQLQRAEIEVMRRSFEDQIYRLTDRLTSTDKRWKDVNHLLVSGQQIGPPNSFETIGAAVPRLEFLKRAGLTEEDRQIDRRLVFALIPFHPDFQELYEEMKKSCSAVGLNCMRGDEEHVTGDLLSHILRLIVKARLIIAVVDGRNPNVFYELGVSHALSKTVLLLAKSPEDIPFDVRSNRIIFYSGMEQLSQKLGLELTKVLVTQGD